MLLHGDCPPPLAPFRFVQDDWVEDTQGRDELDFKRFHMSLFQLTGALWRGCLRTQRHPLPVLLCSRAGRIDAAVVPPRQTPGVKASTRPST